MSDSTSRLSLPLMAAAQAQKHVTHNEALMALDALVMLAVKSRVLTQPPGTIAEGDRYIVASPASGGWSGHENKVAVRQDGAWTFFTAANGWLCWCEADDALLRFVNGGWAPAFGSSFSQIGVNATANNVNRLAVASDATLLTHDGTDHRLVINKSGTANTASLLFQSGFSGRAEIGLAGNNELAFKVSANGTSFQAALTVDPATAKVRLPANNVLENYMLNVYQDSGRLAGNGAAATTVGAFSWPAYLTLNNGATAAAHAKFIFDNNTYGGAAGALDTQVKALIDQIRDAGYRRYNIEFWLAVVTAGSGVTSSPITVGGTTGYNSLYTSFRVRPPALTHHVYLKALDANIIINVVAGQTIRKGTVWNTAPFIVSPGDGWVSILVHDDVAPAQSYGYQPTIFSVYSAAAGQRYLLACPSLIAGLTNLDPNVGIIPSANGWPA